MKMYRGSGGIAPPLLTWTVDGGEWSASHPGERAPGTHWIVGYGEGHETRHYDDRQITYLQDRLTAEIVRSLHFGKTACDVQLKPLLADMYSILVTFRHL
jgi:hypothetical protein